MTDKSQSPLDALTLADLRNRHSVKWQMYEPDVLPLWVAEMDTPLAPPIAAVLSRAVAHGDTGYAFAGGFPAAFADFAGRRYGWDLDPDVPLLVADVMTGVSAALEAVTKPGDAVVLSTPVYPPFFDCLNRLGRRIVSSPLADTADGPRLDLDRLERDFAAGAAAYLLCNPHNPTGLVFSRQELTSIAAMADRYQVAVVCDEIHAPLTMPGSVHIPFATVDGDSAARSFTAVAASKAWNLPGLKAALLVPGSQADVSSLSQDMWVGAGLFGVLAGEAAFTDGLPWLEAVIEGIDLRRRLLGELLAARLPQVRYTAPAGTYLAWLDFRGCGLAEEPADLLLRDGRVALYEGLKFGAEGGGFARLNLATSVDILTEAVDRMARSLPRNA